MKSVGLADELRVKGGKTVVKSTKVDTKKKKMKGSLSQELSKK